MVGGGKGQQSLKSPSLGFPSLLIALATVVGTPAASLSQQEKAQSQPKPGLVETLVVALSVLAAGSSGVSLREVCGDRAWKEGHLELLPREAV